jgi:hypothetical protein
MIPLLTIYLVGVVVTIVACIYGEAHWRTRSERNRPAHPAALTVLAGLVWPLLILGAVQFGGLMLVERFMRSSSFAESGDLIDA